MLIIKNKNARSKLATRNGFVSSVLVYIKMSCKMIQAWNT